MADYKKYLVSMFDILGFKEELKNKTCDEIYNAFKIFELEIKKTESDIKDGFVSGQNMINFSDSVIRFKELPTNPEDVDHAVFDELIFLLHMQYSLINKDILVRGAFTIGDLFIKDKMVYGDGVVKAYDLEQNIAIYPRIIIDSDIIKLVNNAYAKGNWGASYKQDYRDVLCLSDSGLYYLDYLRAIETELDNPEDYPAVLRTHKELIQRRIKKENITSRVKAKIQWLANYHDGVIENISEEAFTKRNLVKNSFIIGTEIL
jgi:hypothetical protein